VSSRCTVTKALELLAPELSPLAASEELTRAINGESCHAYCNGVAIKAHIAAIAKVVPKQEEDGRLTADILSTGPRLGWVSGLNWELEIDDVMALRPQPDMKVEAAQATAISAMQMAEAAAAEATSARAEADRTWVEARTARERAEQAEERAGAAEARVEATASTSAGKPPRKRPGPKYRDDWPRLIATEMIRLARREPEMLENVAGLVAHMQKFLKEEIGWMEVDGNTKEVREEIRLLLGAKRR
jgi:hypothetical protein